MAESAGSRSGRTKGVQILKVDGLIFRTEEELMVYRELRKAQAATPEFDSFSIVTNCMLRALGQTFEVDLVVISRSCTGVIEVDGSFHDGRWAHDRSRDQLLEDSGIGFVHRIDVRAVHSPCELDKFVRRFLARLFHRTAA